MWSMSVYNAHMGIRGQLVEVNSLLLPWEFSPYTELSSCLAASNFTY